MNKISDRLVPDDLYRDAKAYRDRGAKVFLVVPKDDTPDDVRRPDPPVDCQNCNGLGNLGLQVIVGGPYDFVPATEPGNGNPTAGTINGKWYKLLFVPKRYICPVCRGSGGYTHIRPQLPRKQTDLNL